MPRVTIIWMMKNRAGPIRPTNSIDKHMQNAASYRWAKERYQGKGQVQVSRGAAESREKIFDRAHSQRQYGTNSDES
jgi:hypothetical protein